MVKVKICGLTCLEDALAAAWLGADALGFVFTQSPRRIAPETAAAIIAQLPPLVLNVGVFAGEPGEWIEEVRRSCRLDAIQLHGPIEEDELALLGGRIIKAFNLAGSDPPSAWAYPRATLLLDSGPGGSGQTFDWTKAVALARQRPIILAGGLNPENVVEAIKTVRPYGVDVSSGVESRPGRKDHDKLSMFIRLAKAAA